MQLQNNPYCTSRLQGLHVLSLLLCVLFAVFKLLIYGMSSYTGEISEATLERVDKEILLRSRAYNYVDSFANQIEMCTTLCLALFGAYSVYYLWCFYVQFLVALVANGHRNVFKFFTCCRWKLRNFTRANMNRDAYVAKGTAGMMKAVTPAVVPVHSEADMLGDQSSVLPSLLGNAGPSLMPAVEELGDNPLEQLVSYPPATPADTARKRRAKISDKIS